MCIVKGNKLLSLILKNQLLHLQRVMLYYTHAVLLTYTVNVRGSNHPAKYIYRYRPLSFLVLLAKRHRQLTRQLRYGLGPICKVRILCRDRGKLRVHHGGAQARIGEDLIRGTPGANARLVVKLTILEATGLSQPATNTVSMGKGLRRASLLACPIVVFKHIWTSIWCTLYVDQA